MLTFPRLIKLGKIQLYWRQRNTAEEMQIQIPDGYNGWQTVAYHNYSGANEEISVIAIEENYSVQQIRLLQPKDKGPLHPSYRNNMWIAEIEVFEVELTLEPTNGDSLQIIHLLAGRSLRDQGVSLPVLPDLSDGARFSGWRLANGEPFDENVALSVNSTIYAHFEGGDPNLALASLGVAVEVDSSADGYTSASLIDGIFDDSASGLPPNQLSWLSVDVKNEHWAILTFPQPIKLGKIKLHWRQRNTAEEIQVQIPDGDDGWRTVAYHKYPGANEKISTVVLDEYYQVTQVRFLQPQGKGSLHPSFRNRMWLAEIEVFESYPAPSTNPENLALAVNGALVTADSSDAGFSPLVLIDGLRDEPGLTPTQAGWRSGAGGDHWVRIDFAREIQMGKLVLYWRMQNASQEIQVQIFDDASGSWQTVETVYNTGYKKTSVIILPRTVATDHVRLLQPEGMGAPHPALEQKMWLAEVEAFEREDLGPRPEYSTENVHTYVTYYRSNVDQIQGVDVAFIDTRRLGATLEEKQLAVRELQARNIHVFTYICVGEDTVEYNPTMGMKPYYYDDGIGNPMLNPRWGSIYVNSNMPEWHEVVLERIREDAVAVGVDGIFMDVPDSPPAEKLKGYSMIKTIDETFPDLLLVTNRTFSVLELITPHIDGLMFEHFTSTWVDGDSYSLYTGAELLSNDDIAKRLNYLRYTYDFPVFALDYAKPDDAVIIQDSYDRAVANGFVPYVSTRMLENVYTHEVTPTTVWGELIPDPLVLPTASADPLNLALATNGGCVDVDSYFNNYLHLALNDGYRIESAMPWWMESWASANSGQDHWVEVTFARPSSPRRVDIYWSSDNGVFRNGTEVRVEVWNGDAWQEVAMYQESDINVPLFSIGLPAGSPVEKLRVVQPAGSGSPGYTNLMWIAELEVFEGSPDVIENPLYVINGNGQANVEFDIRSANGKGYSIYISEIGEQGPFEPYGNVNYNSKGAHVKGLTNGKVYWAYIQYSDGEITEKSAVVELAPSK